MVRLVRDRVNKIPVRVTSTVDYTGFSASLQVIGVTKNIPNLKASGAKVEFSPEEVETIGSGVDGKITVKDNKGEVYVICMTRFAAVDSEGDAQGFQKITIVLVSRLLYEGGKGSGDFDEDKVREIVDDVVDEVIDEKVDAAVTGIIDDKVTTVVDAVIDEKVESTVNALFDSSDSDTIGGVISGLRNDIEDLEPRVGAIEEETDDNIKPRLDAVETTLAKKVSMDYEDSDEGAVFQEGGVNSGNSD